MGEGPTVFEEVHLVDEVLEEEHVARADEVSDNARGGCCCCRLADCGHVIEAEIVELRHVKLVELVRANETA